jgi:hypothetical protein
MGDALVMYGGCMGDALVMYGECMGDVWVMKAKLAWINETRGSSASSACNAGSNLTRAVAED